jgi:hypothetical protein
MYQRVRSGLGKESREFRIPYYAAAREQLDSMANALRDRPCMIQTEAEPP